MTIARAIESPADMPLAAGAVDCQVVPFEVRMLPEVPGATVCTALVPLPKNHAVCCDCCCARTAVGDREGSGYAREVNELPAYRPV
jgi:hypothetical protein